MIIYIDIDKSIFSNKNNNYDDAIVYHDNIDIINSLYDQNQYIIYWTMQKSKEQENKILQFLKKHKCLYHEIKFNKPDYIIDTTDLNNISSIIQNHLAPFNEYKVDMPLMPDTYTNKNICLIGSGASLEKYEIKYETYDIIVGINRLYETPIKNYINILYNNLSITNWSNISNMIYTLNNLKNFQTLVLCPWFHKKSRKVELYNLLDRYKFQNYLYTNTIVKNIKQIKKRPLTGVAALNHIILSGGKNIDIYGFDFYQEKYTNNLKRYPQHSKYHHIESNKTFFLNLLAENPNIKWHE